MGAARGAPSKRQQQPKQQRQQLPPSTHFLQRQQHAYKTKTTKQAKRASYFDSAASAHMVVGGTDLTNTRNVSDRVVEVADGSEIDVKRSGDVSMSGEGGVLELKEVLEVPSLTDNLISIGVLDREGHRIVIEKGVLTVTKNR